MLIEALFIGENASCGYYTYNRYTLRIKGHTISRPDGTHPVVYESVESFLKNWITVNHKNY